MKRLVTLFSLPLLLASCAKDSDITSASEHNGDKAVLFSASLTEMAQSKAVSMKNTWADGDQVAIFVENADGSYSEPYTYNVDAAGAMSAADAEKVFALKETDKGTYSYCAFYPSNDSFTSIADYQDEVAGDVDMMSSEASGAAAVEFTFVHDLAVLYFDLPFAEAVTSVKIAVGGDAYTVAAEDVVAEDGNVMFSLFVAPVSDISGATLNINNGFYTLANDEFSAWEAGETYTYSSIK